MLTKLSRVGLWAHDSNTSKWLGLPKDHVGLLSALFTISELKDLVGTLNECLLDLMRVIVHQFDGAVPRSDCATVLHGHPILVHGLFLEIMLGLHGCSGLILLQDHLIGTRLFRIQDAELHRVSFPFVLERASLYSATRAVVVRTLLGSKNFEVSDSVDTSLPVNNLVSILNHSIFIRKIKSACHERLLGDPPIALSPSQMAFDLLPVSELRAVAKDGQGLTPFELLLDFELALIGRILNSSRGLRLSRVISGIEHVFYLD